MNLNLGTSWGLVGRGCLHLILKSGRDLTPTKMNLSQVLTFSFVLGFGV